MHVHRTPTDRRILPDRRRVVTFAPCQQCQTVALLDKHEGWLICSVCATAENRTRAEKGTR
jgi:hypothetical protein